MFFASDLMRGSHAKFMKAEKQTNDLGEYRLAHLAPDKYYLAVQARPWYAQPQVSAQMGHHRSVGNGGPAFFAPGPGVASDPLFDVVYPLTFYPGGTDEGSSAGLVLSAGEKQEANITLRAGPATRLRLTAVNNEAGTSFGVDAGQRVFGTFTLGQGQLSGVVQLDGKPAPGVMVLLVPKSGQEMEEDSRMDESDSDGTFSLGGILPGDYVLLALKDGWDLEWSNSEVLRPYLSAGEKRDLTCHHAVE